MKVTVYDPPCFVAWNVASLTLSVVIAIASGQKENRSNSH
ncbi:hypothetical protein DFJ75_3512 [Williamsia muralis]|uniref:Uncharacterized protein n=1 Tax=Williamsia marianensis TaxID=85044 RepID=A0A495K823_WILMA|nr:hypothetical protein DFJ75_3512 [Williamsia muralis]